MRMFGAKFLSLQSVASQVFPLMLFRSKNEFQPITMEPTINIAFPALTGSPSIDGPPLEAFLAKVATECHPGARSLEFKILVIIIDSFCLKSNWCQCHCAC